MTLYNIFTTVHPFVLMINAHALPKYDALEKINAIFFKKLI